MYFRNGMSHFTWRAALRCLDGPIPRTPVMLVDCLFQLAIEFCRRIVLRRVFDGLTSQIDRDFGL
jgi:hypothetical protein